MQYVTLGQTGIVTSALGYGCSGLMRPPTSRERVALLETAFDAGIRHFDTARYYGYGASEGVLGSFVRDAGRRDKVTITTKFGIVPPSIGGASRWMWAMGLARRVAALHPAVRQLLGRSANRKVRTGCFDPNSARRSLETSLRELKTEHVDLLLLHEATLMDTREEGLRAFLEDVHKQGKIRAYGIGSDFAHVPDIIADAPEFARVLQIANGVDHPYLRRLAPDPLRAVLTHSALKPLRALAKAALVPANRSQFHHWLEMAGLDRETSLARVLLSRARQENPSGVVLFSSVIPSHIQTNTIALERSPGGHTWQEFEQIIGGWLHQPNNAARL